MFSHFRKVPGVHDECHDGQPDGVHGPAARGSLRQVKILLRGIDAGIYSVQGTTDMPTFRKLTQQLSFGEFFLKESRYTDFLLHKLYSLTIVCLLLVETTCGKLTKHQVETPLGNKEKATI